MTEEQFFNTAAYLLTQNPIRRADIGAQRTLHKLGLHPGSIFSLDFFRPDTAQFIREGYALGRATVLAERERILRRNRESWGPFVALRDNPRDYVNRAARSHIAPHTPSLEHYLKFSTSRDSIGEPLHSSCRYNLRFEASDLPPTDAVWSLSAVDLCGRLTMRKPGRSIGNHRQLHFEPDGSLQIHIESTRSRRSEGGLNWLQCPQGRFTLALELFDPRSEALQGFWLPPLVERQHDRKNRPAARETPPSGLASVSSSLVSRFGSVI